ncbi:MAG: MFS transporter [Chloroflexi bacterium]|nr:MFS transporter [Chloroflexota bacterium]
MRNRIAQRLNTTLHRTFTALENRNYRLFYTGYLLSLVGTWMQTTAQGWLVYRLTDSPFYLGLVGFMSSVPVLFLSLFAGAITDRVPRQKLVIVTQTLAMLQAFLLAYLTLTHQVQIWHVMALSAFLGVVNAFDIPARQIFVVDLVGKDKLMNAIALNSSAFNAARIFGPAMAGVFVALIGEGGCFLLNGVSFLAVLVSLVLIKLPPRNVTEVRNHSLMSNMVEGVGYVRQTSILLILISLVGVSNLFAVPYTSMLPAFAQDVLHVGATGLGLLSAAVGIGALFSALVLAALSHFPHKGRLLTIGNFVFPVALVIFSFSHVFAVSLVALAFVGLGLIMQNSMANILIQTLSPDAMRGRVMSMFSMIAAGLAPLGTLQVGTLSEFLGVSLTVALGALVALAYNGFIFIRHSEVRDLI